MLGRPQPGGPDHSAQLIDRFGRVAKDLRVSLTDRCNLRCTYCMPAEGLRWLPADELLSTGELQRLTRIAVQRFGIEEIRCTGGEPLLRADLTPLVGFAADLTPKPRLSSTTNGLGLARKADELARAGLGRINVSLDSADAATYTAITRRDRLADVLEGLSAARDAVLNPIKINAVLMRGVTDNQPSRCVASVTLPVNRCVRSVTRQPSNMRREREAAGQPIQALQQPDRFGRGPDRSSRRQFPGLKYRLVEKRGRPLPCGAPARESATAGGPV
jgi:uncharacterized radical SAM superfamily Fe-S cluster-containing enzyme